MSRLLRKRNQTKILPIKKSNFIYTDGSCLNNGSFQSLAGIGIYFGNDDSRNVSKKIKSNQKITNNIAELLAIKEVLLYHVNDHQSWTIVSDSLYSIQAITKWIHKWKKNDWKTSSGQEVKNKHLIQDVFNLYDKHKAHVDFLHVLSHTDKDDRHSKGNYYADQLAVKGSNIQYENKKNVICFNLNPVKTLEQEKYAKLNESNKKWVKVKEAQGFDCLSMSCSTSEFNNFLAFLNKYKITKEKDVKYIGLKICSSFSLY